MGSHGGISLKGFGETIKQLRELKKDKDFRNQQEAIIGWLEVFKKVQEVKREFGLSDIEIKMLIKYITENVEKNDDVTKQMFPLPKDRFIL